MDNIAKIEVGTGVTYCSGTDRYPYTVVEVRGPKTLVIQQDNYKRTDGNGMSEDQTYEYTPNPDAERRVITLRKNGRWCEEGVTSRSSAYHVGERRAYYDFCR